MPHATPELTVTLTHQAKPPLHSRTLWLNALALGLALAESKLQLLQAVLPVNVYVLLAFALPVLNVMLRMVTSMPLDLPGTQPPAPPSITVGQQEAP